MFLSETYTIHDYLQVPKLDGTESIYQISGTTSHSNGEMSGGSSYLTNGFDNSGDWELTCQVKFSGNNCAVLLFPPSSTSRDTNEMGVTAYYQNRVIWYNNGSFSNISGSNMNINTFHELHIVKNGSSLVVSINNATHTVSSWNQTSSASKLHIGLGSWTTSGNTATIKDIVVKPL